MMFQWRDSEGHRSGLGHWAEEGAPAEVSLCLVEAEVQDDTQWGPEAAPTESQTLATLKPSQGLFR